MSKMDALRAMREARYDEMTKRATKPTPGAKPVKAAARPPAKASSGKAAAAGEPVEAADSKGVPEEQLCGHRAISGRTCTREQGHSAKSHRYA